MYACHFVTLFFKHFCVIIADIKKNPWHACDDFRREGLNNMKKRIIVISVDSMFTEDLSILYTLPNFKSIMGNGSRINKMESIYPSLTYPAHVSMMTGCYPDKHGVIHNQKLSPGVSNPDWLFYSENIKVKTIFQAAKEKGYTTACCHWPVCANGNDYIDYLIPEIWTKDPDGDMIACYEGSGASGVGDILRKNAHRLKWKYFPMYDDFITDCACDIIKEKKPDLLLIHYSEVDHLRHRHGLFNHKITEGLCRIDDWVGQIISSTKEAGIDKETNVVITSDHGHLEVKRNIHLNPLLVDEGLIILNNDQTIASWDAFIQSAGLSAYVYLSKKFDDALNTRVYRLLNKMAEDGVYGFNEVLTKGSVENRFNLSGEFSFMIETDGYTRFGNKVVGPVVQELDFSDYTFSYSSHGHMPNKGPQPAFLCMGPNFNRDIILNSGRIIDQAPTYAKILGVNLPEADGKPIDALIK